MNDLPRPADWTHQRGERQMMRGVLAAVALLAGVAVLAVAGTILVRQAIDSRAQPPVTTAPVFDASDTTTAVPPPTTGDEDEPTLDETTSDAPPPTFAVRPLLIDVDPSLVREVVDDSGTLSVSVPGEWTDTATSSWMRDGSPIGVRINSATDRDAWFAGWDTPGAFIGVTDAVDPASLYGDFSAECDYGGRATVEVALTPADVDIWTDCGGLASVLAVIVVPDVSGEGHTMLIQVIVVGENWLGFSAIVESVAFSD